MHRSRYLRVAALLLLLAGTRTYALDANRHLKEFGHQAWLTENGLPQNTVVAIAQTADGYLWVGTQEGLARFDGVRLTVFSNATVQAFRSNRITAVVKDRAGSLWLGTDDGLVHYSNGTFTAIGVNDGLPQAAILCLYEDPSGRL